MSETSPHKFIPCSRAEMIERGWDELDVLFITGDAYIDHPSFGTSLLARLLEDEGLRVGILAQHQRCARVTQEDVTQACRDTRTFDRRCDLCCQLIGTAALRFNA